MSKRVTEIGALVQNLNNICAITISTHHQRPQLFINKVIVKSVKSINAFCDKLYPPPLIRN